MDELTADDLMRLHERPRKRMRLFEQPSLSSNSGSSVEDDADSNEQDDVPGASSENDEDQHILDMAESSHESITSTSLDIGTASRVSTTSRARTIAPTRNLKPLVEESSWTSLNISSALQSALSSMSIRKPTDIQGACIPPLLAGKFFSS
jgi:ATP-dependent RNA helicase DDX49/DBP8